MKDQRTISCAQALSLVRALYYETIVGLDQYDNECGNEANAMFLNAARTLWPGLPGCGMLSTSSNVYAVTLRTEFAYFLRTWADALEVVEQNKETR